jgi:predicted alpha/beta superfamily hydrolase
MRIFFSILFTVVAIIAFAQNNNGISIGIHDTIYSNILKEKRQLLIYLPDNYKIHQQYPVVYLLDGENFFHFFTGITSFIGGGNIPEMIVVGIVNTNRYYDFTPTYDPNATSPNNGGGEAFTSFMENELMPYIETHYNTAHYRLLVGHSLGGLLALNTLLKHSDLFNSYIILDPSLWWDSTKLFKESSRLLQEKQYQNKTLFLAMSNGSEGTMDTMDEVFQFRDKLKENPGDGLKWMSKFYADEYHGSLPLIGSYDALKFIFDFYKRPSLSKLTDSTPAILEKHYRQISEKIGFTILPSEYDLNGLAWRCAVLEKNYDRAYLFLQLYQKLYPNSTGMYAAFGDYYEGKGDKNKAMEYRDKANKSKKE